MRAVGHAAFSDVSLSAARHIKLTVTIFREESLAETLILFSSTAAEKRREGVKARVARRDREWQQTMRSRK